MLFCNVTDVNSSVQVTSGYNVSFYRNNSFWGSNTTNSTGIAVFLYQDNTNVVNNVTVQQQFNCTIGPEHGLFYTTIFSSNVSRNMSIVRMVSVNLTDFSLAANATTYYNRGGYDSSPE